MCVYVCVVVYAVQSQSVSLGHDVPIDLLSKKSENDALRDALRVPVLCVRNCALNDANPGATECAAFGWCTRHDCWYAAGTLQCTAMCARFADKRVDIVGITNSDNNVLSSSSSSFWRRVRHLMCHFRLTNGCRAFVVSAHNTFHFLCQRYVSGFVVLSLFLLICDRELCVRTVRTQNANKRRERV